MGIVTEIRKIKKYGNTKVTTCPVCKTEIHRKAAFCPYCGAETTEMNKI